MQFKGMSDQPGATIIFLAVGLLLVLMFAGSPAMAAEKKIIDGVEHIQNPNTPTGGSIEIHLKELWRAGGSDGDLIFGMLTQFTGGNMTLDLDDEEGSVEIIYCEMERE